MAARLTFLGIAAFWLTMNVLLWRSEFGLHGGDLDVPLPLIWHKLLTTPDSSSLTVYQNGERSGYCEVSTGVARQMASVDAMNVLPAKLSTKGGYQLHLAGNVSFGDFTNRLKFEGHISFYNLHEWRDFTLKFNTRQMVLVLNADATNGILNLKISNDGVIQERNFTFEELKKPEAVMRSILGGNADAILSLIDLPEVDLVSAAGKPEWTAMRTRVKIGNETMPVYRLQTSLLGHPIVVDISTVGEVLRVDLPGQISARIDEWRRP